jgi:uncharacterized protein
MAIAHEPGPQESEFVLRLDGRRRGYLSYTSANGVMRIEYVEVDPDLRGGGHARPLVEAAVAFAKQQQWRVVPICGYARAVIQRDPALADAL